MFWNDPNLYTANIPYREFGTFPGRDIGFPPTQVPFAGPAFMPWQNVPRFIPPVWGMLPHYDPRMMFNNPFVATAPHPFLQQPFNNPLVATTPQPFLQQPFNMNPALYNPYRPITY